MHTQELVISNSKINLVLFGFKPSQQFYRSETQTLSSLNSNRFVSIWLRFTGSCDQ